MADNIEHEETPAEAPAQAAEAPEAPVTEPAETQAGPLEAQGVPTDAETTDALTKARREAAERRVAAKQAQAEAEAARTELAATQQRLTLMQDKWLAQHLYRSGVGVDAFKAAGYTAESMLDQDGNLDAGTFAAAVADTANRFGRISIANGYVPSAGTGIGSAPVSTWADVIKG